METVTGGSCETDSNSGMPADDCIYMVDGPAELKSSVMAIPYFPGTLLFSVRKHAFVMSFKFVGNDQWCDITEDRIHDSDLPNKHNTMCNGDSVFEVKPSTQ